MDNSDESTNMVDLVSALTDIQSSVQDPSKGITMPDDLPLTDNQVLSASGEVIDLDEHEF